MAKERWRPIDDYPSYRVSDQGRVQNQKTGRILKDADDGNGYRMVVLCSDGKCRSTKVHKLVATAFIPDHASGLEINHIDGDKSNNAVSNLEWVDRSKNMTHAISKGLWDTRRPVRVIETGEVYASELECAKAIGGNVAHVQHCAAGLRKTHRGLHYEFV